MGPLYRESGRKSWGIERRNMDGKKSVLILLKDEIVRVIIKIVLLYKLHSADVRVLSCPPAESFLNIESDAILK